MRWLVLIFLWAGLWLWAGCGFSKEVSPDLANADLLSAADLASFDDLVMPIQTKAVVFTTSTSWAGGLNGTPGMLAADFLCQNSAIAGGFGNRTFRAWLSDDGHAAVDRVLGTGPWVRRDGPTAFDGRPDKPPKIPLNTDENGLALPVNSKVWTGTLGSGQPAMQLSCSGWGSGDAGLLGVIGDADTSVVVGWTDDGSRHCDVPSHLYCFESP